MAAVILPEGSDLDEVRDSKQLSEKARNRVFSSVRRQAAAWAAIAVPVPEIDRLNILGASLWGMGQAVRKLRVRPDLVLVDGSQLPPGLDVEARCLVGGDDRSQCVGAASIVAKVLRDRLMRAWDRRFPQYGFARNVGYPTPEHLRAIREHGVCALHRRSFRPVALAATQPPLPF